MKINRSQEKPPPHVVGVQRFLYSSCFQKHAKFFEKSMFPATCPTSMKSKIHFKSHRESLRRWTLGIHVVIRVANLLWDDDSPDASNPHCFDGLLKRWDDLQRNVQGQMQT